METLFYCRNSGECPDKKSYFSIPDGAKQVAGLTFELYVLIFNIIWID